MVSQTNEQVLEVTIEKALSGISREALKDQVGNGYQSDRSSDCRKMQISEDFGYLPPMAPNTSTR